MAMRDNGWKSKKKINLKGENITFLKLEKVEGRGMELDKILFSLYIFF